MGYRMVRSSLPDTTCSLSGVNTADFTMPSCPSKTFQIEDCFQFHIITLLSTLQIYTKNEFLIVKFSFFYLYIYLLPS